MVKLVSGLHYAFKPNQSKIVSLLWISVISVLTFLGFYLSLQNFIEWKKEPVVTTVTTTGLPIADVPFPSVVICSEGFHFTKTIISRIFKSSTVL